MNFLRDENGKLSNARLMSFIAFIFALSLCIYVVTLGTLTKNYEAIEKTSGLIISMLTFAATTKTVSKFAEGRK